MLTHGQKSDLTGRIRDLQMDLSQICILINGDHHAEAWTRMGDAHLAAGTILHRLEPEGLHRLPTPEQSTP